MKYSQNVTDKQQPRQELVILLFPVLEIRKSKQFMDILTCFRTNYYINNSINISISLCIKQISTYTNTEY